jgi:hypothetical protein
MTILRNSIINPKIVNRIGIQKGIAELEIEEDVSFILIQGFKAR